MDVALEVVALLDDCCYRAVTKCAVLDTTVHVHRDPSTREAQGSATIPLTVEWDLNLGRLVVSAGGISSVEHTFLDFMLMPVHRHEAKGHTGPPQHLIRQYGVRFEQKSQVRTAHGNRPRGQRSQRDPDDRRYAPAPAPSGTVLRSRAERVDLVPRHLIIKRPRSGARNPARRQARNALDAPEPIPVYVPEVESSSDTDSDQ